MKSKNNLGFKSNKSFVLFGILFLLLFLSLSGVSAVKKTYDSENKTVKLKSNFLFFETGDIAEVKLLTPLKNSVGSGYVRVAEYEVRGMKNINRNFYNEVKSYNKYKYKKGDRTEIEKVFDLKRKINKTVVVEDYECDSSGEECWVVGSHEEIEEDWIDFDPKTKVKKGETVIIGLYTKTLPHEYVEWVPTFINEEIEEWAGYIVEEPFYDTFATSGNTFTYWTESGEGDWVKEGKSTGITNDGSWVAHVDNCDTSCTLTSDDIDLSSYTDASLTFNWGNTGLDAGEYVNLDYYDGTAWNNIIWASGTGTSSGSQTINLTTYGLSSTSKLRFNAKVSSSLEYGEIDIVNITATYPNVTVELNITDPVNAIPLGVKEGYMIPLTFKYLSDDSEVSTGVSMENVTIGGVQVYYADDSSYFYDTFPSTGAWTQWTETAGTAWTIATPQSAISLGGSYVARSTSCNGCQITSDAIDLSLYDSANVTFNWGTQNQDAGDYLRLDYYNGQEWIEVWKTTTGTGSGSVTVELAEYRLHSSSQLRFVSWGSSSDYAEFDIVNIATSSNNKPHYYLKLQY